MHPPKAVDAEMRSEESPRVVNKKARSAGPFQDIEASRDREWEWDSGDDSSSRRDRAKKRRLSKGGNEASAWPRRSLRISGKEQRQSPGSLVPAEKQQEVGGLRREVLVLERKMVHQASVLEAKERKISSSKQWQALTLGSEEQKTERLEKELEHLKGKTAQMKFKNEGLKHQVLRSEKQYALSLAGERQKVEQLQREVEQYRGVAGRMGVEIVGLKDHAMRCVASLVHKTRQVAHLEKGIVQLQQEMAQKAGEIERLHHKGAYAEKKHAAALAEKKKMVKRLGQKVEHLEEHVRTALQEADEARTRAHRSALKQKECEDRAEREANAASTWERRANRSQRNLAVAVADGARKIQTLEQQHAAALTEERNETRCLEEKHASTLSIERRENAHLERRLSAALESGPEEVIRLRRKLGRSRQLSAELALTVEEAKRLSDEHSKFLAKRIADMKRAKLGKKEQAILWRESSDTRNGGGSSGGRLAMAPQVTVTIDEYDSFPLLSES